MRSNEPSFVDGYGEGEDEVRRVGNGCEDGGNIGQGLQSSLNPTHLFSTTEGEVESYINEVDENGGIPSLNVGNYEE